MRKIRIYLLLSLLCAVSLLTGCGNPPQVRFGMIAPESGKQQVLGKEMVDGALVFTDEVNNRKGFFGGYIVNIVHYDYADNPGQAIELTQRLIESDKVLGIAAYVEDPAILASVAEICRKNNTQLVSISGAGWQLPSRDFIELGPDKINGWYQVVDYALNANPNCAVAYINPQPQKPAHSAELIKTLVERNRTPVLHNVGALEPPDSIEMAANLRNNNAKLIFVDGGPTDADPIAYQLMIERYKAVFVFLQAQDFPEKLLVMDLSLFADSVMYSHFSPLQTDLGARRFIEGYHSRRGRDPNSYLAVGYDAMTLLAQAWKQEKRMDGASIKSAVLGKKWQLATVTLESGVPQSPPKVRLLIIGKDNEDKPIIMLATDSQTGK